MNSDELYKAHLRAKGQLTLPAEVREVLGAEEGDDLLFRVAETGQVYVERAITIPADQAWFWSERWQKMERAVQADIDAGRMRRFSDVDEAITALEQDADARD